MDKKISPVDLLRLWLVGIIVLVAAFLLALVLMSCGTGGPTPQIRKGLSRITEGAVTLARLDAMTCLKT
jgi:hypothetical protein